MWFSNMFEQLEELADEEQSKKMSAYMQNRFCFLGISKPKLKELIKPYLQLSKKLNFDWGFVFQCWEKPYREAQYIAVEYVLMHQKKLVDSDLDKVKLLVTQKSWWETVDSLDAVVGTIVKKAVVGTIVKKHNELKNIMIEWSLADNIWLRRVAIDFQQKYKESTDSELLSQIIKNNFGSDEFFINKGIFY